MRKLKTLCIFINKPQVSLFEVVALRMIPHEAKCARMCYISYHNF